MSDKTLYAQYNRDGGNISLIVDNLRNGLSINSDLTGFYNSFFNINTATGVWLDIWGVIVGATILAYLPERIRFISTARQLVFGLALVIIMNVRPDGLLPRKKREKIKAKGAGN